MTVTETRGTGKDVAPPQPPEIAVRTPRRVTLRRLLRNRLAVAGIVLIGLLTLAAVFAPTLASEHPNDNGIWKVNLRTSLEPPSLAHPLGTDQLGRDQLSRMVYGARVSLVIGFVAVSLAICIGTLFGSLAGYAGGMTDNIVMRFMDIMLAFPSILLALAIVALIGPGLINVMIAVGIVSIPTYARISRASVMAETVRDYVEASRALGAGRPRVLFRHLLPNSLSPLIVAASLGIGTAILEAAALGFLGLGAQPPLAEWGLMLSDNRQKLFTEWWLVVVPGVAIMVTVLGFNLLGDGLRDVLDPRLRHRGH
jgi:ABC-type dipeptide/oligopeptide/nickel transport system permease subunit